MSEILKGYFESISDYNPTFKKVKLRIFAFGENDNLSNISPESFELAKETIYNIPIVAKYNENEIDRYGSQGDLEGHNTKIKKDKDGNWILFQDTVPLGVIPSDAEISYEEINEGTEENPNIKTYVVADNCLLWMRYDASQKIEEWLNNGINPSISMEINPLSGEIKGNYYHINSFNFEAVCVLSSELEPCFKNADIEEYSKKNFKEMYCEMIDELKNYSESELNSGGDYKTKFKKENNSNTIVKSDKGGNIVNEKLELLKQYSLVNKDEIKKIEDDIETYSLDELKEKLDFILNSQVNKGLSIAVRKEKIEDDWGYEYSRYWLVDFDYDKSKVYVEDSQDYYNIYKFNYAVDGDNIVIDFESGAKQKVVFEDWDEGTIQSFSLSTVERVEKLEEIVGQYKEKYEQEKEKYEKIEKDLNAKNEKYSDLEKSYNEIKQENDNLIEFKSEVEQQQRKHEEEVLFEKYSKVLNKEVIEKIKADAGNYTIKELDMQLKILWADLNLSAEFDKKDTSKKLNKKKDASFNFEKLINDSEKSSKPYADIIKKYQ